MYKLVNKRNETLTMRDGSPFIYTTQWTARLGAKYLRPKTPKQDRPIRVVSA